MRNFRKTRKRGGAGIVFHCLPKRTATKTCINDFVASNAFTFTDVAPDGNCFFHTLHLYFKNRQDPVALADADYYKELRRVIINYLAANIANYAVFGLTMNDVNALRGDGAWDEAAGDYVVPAAAAALGLEINLYDLQDPIPGRPERKASGKGKNAVSYMPAIPPTPKHIVHHVYPEAPPAGWVQRGVIHIMRMNDSHFGLLEPVAAPAAAPPAPAKKKGKPTVAPAAAPAARAPSPPRLTARQQAAAAAKAAKAARQPSPPKRTTRRKPVVAPSAAQLNANLQAAILASIQNQEERQQKKQQNNNAALAAAMQQGFNAERNKIRKQEKNNANLARALAMSLGQMPSGSNQFAHGSNVFDRTP